MINYSYIRGSVSVALANISGGTKGQLQAFSESAMARTTIYTRKRVRTVELEKRTVCADTDPLKSTQTRVSREPLPPIHEITFFTASWRRAVSELNSEHNAWIKYCYGHDLNYELQIEIARFISNEFSVYLKASRISKKIANCFLCHFEQLAVQVVAYDLRGVKNDKYTQVKLAHMAGVKPDNWNKHYHRHWEKLLELCYQLDMDSLRAAQNKRHEAFSRKIAS